MALERERKFLARGTAWKEAAAGLLYRQGYFRRDALCVVRVRLAGERGFLAVKGPAFGLARAEYEYEIPPLDAQAMLLELADKPLIEKIRRRVAHGGMIWEVDEFLGENQGLVVAEVELEREEQPLSKPAWAGFEVTGLERYYNSALVDYPFSRWQPEEKQPEGAALG
ncbi:MAG: CYTH domain-containing protein [Deltaproteobacteria bacterium]|nr:CYTH domain-containing protein [Deltaproteobacteria bacterium]